MSRKLEQVSELVVRSMDASRAAARFREADDAAAAAPSVEASKAVSRASAEAEKAWNELEAACERFRRGPEDAKLSPRVNFRNRHFA